MSTLAVSLPGSSRASLPGYEPAPLPGPRGGSKVVWAHALVSSPHSGLCTSGGCPAPWPWGSPKLWPAVWAGYTPGGCQPVWTTDMGQQMAEFLLWPGQEVCPDLTRQGKPQMAGWVLGHQIRTQPLTLTLDATPVSGSWLVLQLSRVRAVPRGLPRWPS